MAVLIKDPDADRLIRELAGRTGETITQAVKEAVRERLRRLPLSEQDIAARKRKIAKILAKIDALPRINEHLTDDELLGYDENGLPT